VPQKKKRGQVTGGSTNKACCSSVAQPEGRRLKPGRDFKVKKELQSEG